MNEKKQRPLVSVTEFLEVTRLSEAQCLAMLERGALNFERAPDGALIIDLSGFTPEHLAEQNGSAEAQITAEEQELLEELVGGELLRTLEPMIEQAFEMALSWQRDEQPPALPSEKDPTEQ